MQTLGKKEEQRRISTVYEAASRSLQQGPFSQKTWSTWMRRCWAYDTLPHWPTAMGWMVPFLTLGMWTLELIVPPLFWLCVLDHLGPPNLASSVIQKYSEVTSISRDAQEDLSRSQSKGASFKFILATPVSVMPKG